MDSGFGALSQFQQEMAPSEEVLSIPTIQQIGWFENFDAKEKKDQDEIMNAAIK